ncbi:MAG: hypothetical protein AB8E82_17825 [Aureispira sp.]
MHKSANKALLILLIGVISIALYGWGGAFGTYFKIDVAHDLAYVMMIQLAPYRQLGLRPSLQHYIEATIIN